MLPNAARAQLASLVARAVIERLAGLWLALLVLGAVILGPNGLDARDITRGLRATPAVALLVFALWSAVHVRAARVLDAREFAFVRALPLSSVDRFVTLAAPMIAPHALVGAFFAHAEGALAGAASALVSAGCTLALRSLARRIEARPMASRTTPRSLLSAHARFALRVAPSSIARAFALTIFSTLLSTIAVANTRVAPTAQSSLATVLLLLSSGAVAAAVTGVVRESERSLALLVATQPAAQSAALRAHRIAVWASPSAIGALSAAIATSTLGLRAALFAALSFAWHWLAVALCVDAFARRGTDPASAATALSIGAVIAALVGHPTQLLFVSGALVTVALFTVVRR